MNVTRHAAAVVMSSQPAALLHIAYCICDRDKDKDIDCDCCKCYLSAIIPEAVYGQCKHRVRHICCKIAAEDLLTYQGQVGFGV